MTEPVSDPQTTIDRVRQNVVESSALITMGFGTLLFAFAAIRGLLFNDGFNPLFALLYAFALGTFLLRHHYPAKWHFALLLGWLTLAATIGLVTFGLAGHAIIVLLVIILLSATVYGPTAGSWVCGVCVALLLGVMTITRLGWLHPAVDATSYFNHPFAWLTSAALLVGVSLAIRSQSGHFAAQMMLLWHEQEARAAALRETNEQLRAEVAERARVEASLREHEQSYRDLFSLSPDAVFVVHSGVITDLNAAALVLLRVWQPERAIGTRFGDWVSDIDGPDTEIAIHPADRPAPSAPANSPLADLELRGREVRLKAADGRDRIAELRVAGARIDGKQAILATLRDITDRKKAEARVMRLAQHDALTDLPNRAMLESRLEHALRIAARHRRRVAVMFIDLDRFKTINDTLGHATGDQLLIEVGKRLTSVCRPRDLLARLGGDEFVLLLADIDRIEDVTAVAERILAALREPVRLERYELTATPSIGISTYPDDGEDGPTLLKHADAAMYHSKSAGRNTYRYFLPQMNRAALDRIALEQKLRNGLKEDAFELHYQIQVDRDRRFVGMEGLLRWTLPGEGPISPDRFIPIAEEIGLIVPLGEWVLDRACRQAREWLDAGMPAFRISVNLSPAQLRNTDFLASVERILKRHDVPPAIIELEITETAAMENPQEAIQVLSSLKRLGLMLAIDDFGTGYSSLSYLKLFPIDRLKIDRSFVRDLVDDPNDRAIAQATIALAHSLGLKVVAEGVETEEQAAMLASFDCDEMQGYLFGRPMPVAQVEAGLHNKKARNPAQTEIGLSESHIDG